MKSIEGYEKLDQKPENSIDIESNDRLLILTPRGELYMLSKDLKGKKQINTRLITSDAINLTCHNQNIYICGYYDGVYNVLTNTYIDEERGHYSLLLSHNGILYGVTKNKLFD